MPKLSTVFFTVIIIGGPSYIAYERWKWQTYVQPPTVPAAPLTQEEQEAREQAIRSYEISQQRIEAENRAKFGPKPAHGIWGSSIDEVDDYLTRAASDPDSLDIEECTEATATTTGWATRCIFRLKNGFGGMVRHDKYFMIAHGEIIATVDANNFRGN